MPGMCQAYAWYMPGICFAEAWHMLGICLACARHRPGICLAYSGHMPSMCLAGMCLANTCTRHMPGIYLACATHMRGACLAYTRHMGMCLLYAWRFWSGHGHRSAQNLAQMPCHHPDLILWLHLLGASRGQMTNRFAAIERYYGVSGRLLGEKSHWNT